MLDRLTSRERLIAAGLLAAALAAAVLGLLQLEGAALAALSAAVLLTGLVAVETRARSRRLGRQLQARLDTLQALTGTLQARTEELSGAVDRVAEEVRRPREDVLEARAEVAEVQTAVLGRLEELSQQVGNAWQPKDKRWDRLTTRLSRDRVELQRQLLAMAQLLRDVDVDTPLPATGGWAAEASTLVRLREIVRVDRPRLVVECGSGASTVWLAHMLRPAGGRLVSLEHDLEFAEQTRQQLRAHGLADVAEVRDAPLTEVEVEGETLTWYDTAAVTDLEGVELLFVDGPPQGVHPTVRYPALPVLRPRLGPRAVVVLDDAHRPGERDVLARWLAEHEDLRVVEDSVDRAVTLELGGGAVAAPAPDAA